MDAGTQVGPYRIVRQIGEGGMGAVYLAEHALIGRRAAIKVLLPELSARRELVERFFNEARAITAITDPGIVQVFDFGVHADGAAYLVMELLDGESLEARLRARGRLSVLEALRVARQLATSLAAAHARGVVHRDLKPENVFLVADPEAQGGERPKLLDFGIAKLGDADGASRSRTRTGVLMGTPIYMSPEQCRGAGDVDARSDIYSLGCVLYTMLCGRPPFDAEGVGEIISAHLREAVVPPSVHAPHVHPAIDALMLRCLAKDPAARFATMGELAAALERLAAALSAPPPVVPLADGLAGARVTPTTLSHASGARTGDAPPRVRRRGIVVALCVAAVAAGSAVAIVAPRDHARGPAVASPAPMPVRAPVDAAVPDAAAAIVETPPPDAAPVALAPPPPPPPPTSPPRRAPRHPARAPAPTPTARPAQELYDTR